MIRKDKLVDNNSEDSLEKVSSEDKNIATVHDIEARALAAFSDTKDSQDNE